MALNNPHTSVVPVAYAQIGQVSANQELSGYNPWDFNFCLFMCGSGAKDNFHR